MRSSIPPCEVVGPDGQRLVVHPISMHDRVEDLATAVGIRPGVDVVIDGRPVDQRTPLIDSGLRWGSQLHDASVSPRPQTHRQPAPDDGTAAVVLRWAVVAGPACSPWRPLAAGRSVVGRSPHADLHVADTTVETHHVLVTASETALAPVAQGSPVSARQLTGRSAVRIETMVAPADGAPHCTIAVGTSLLTIAGGDDAGAGGDDDARRGTLAAVAGDPWRSVVHRPPPPAAAPTVDDLVAPEPATLPAWPAASGLVGATVAATFTGVVAVAMGHLMFAAFAAVGAGATIATWAVTWCSAGRHRRRARRDHDEAAHAFADEFASRHRRALLAHRRRHVGITDTLTDVFDLRSDTTLWRRRLSVDGALWVTCGRGAVAWEPAAMSAVAASLPADRAALARTCATLDDVDVPLALVPGSTIGVCGPGRLTWPLVRSIVVQAAATYGPADWRMVVVTSQRTEWQWLEWLPHETLLVDAATSSNDDRLAGFGGLTGLDAASTEAETVTVVLVDDPPIVAERPGHIRRLLGSASVVGLVVVPERGSVPAICDAVVDVGVTGAVNGVPGVVAARVAGITAATGLAAARRLAGLRDPEAGSPSTALPSEVGLADLVADGTDAASIARRWQCGGDDPPPAAPIGRTADGVVHVDLAGDGPHALIAGTTGAGKSELLRTLVVSLAVHVSPQHLNVVLVDFKGGATFDACARLPHTVGVVTDLDDGLARRALVSLDAEVGRRERILRDAGAENLAHYRAGSRPPLARLVVVVDEFAGLAAEHPDLLDGLVAIAQRGRSLGIHLVLATQRPAGAVTDDIRANTAIRWALRLHDRADAHDVIGDPRPVGFPREMPGRAALRLGGDDPVILQTATCHRAPPPQRDRLWIERREPASTDASPLGAPTPEGAALGQLVDAICEAALLAETGEPHRPWLEPLPHRLTRLAAHADGISALGLVDDPADQRQHPLVWQPGLGNLALIGALGSGTTATAIGVVTMSARTRRPSELHVFVVDGRGEQRWDAVASMEHCASVIRLHETERLERLLRHLEHELDHRMATRTHRPDVLVVVDGFVATRAVIGAGDPSRTAGFDRIVADGPSVGITFCATADGPSPSALMMPASQRWVFHLDDPLAAGACGTASVPSIPGRCVLAGSGLEAQVLCPDALDRIAAEIVAAPGGGDGPPAIVTLPDHVDPATLVDPGSDGGDPSAELWLPLGVDADDLGVASLVVPHGDHVFIGGTARTGMTTVLAQVVAAWRMRRPDGLVVEVGGETVDDVAEAVLAARQAGLDVLVTVDDADRVAGDALAALAEERDPGLMIVAAARLDAVRSAYGHWVRAVARRRCGVVLTAPGEVDGELLGAFLPRHSWIAPRAGLAWVVDRRGSRLVQIADRRARLRA